MITTDEEMKQVEESLKVDPPEYLVTDLVTQNIEEISSRDNMSARWDKALDNNESVLLSKRCTAIGKCLEGPEEYHPLAVIARGEVFLGHQLAMERYGGMNILNMFGVNDE